MHLIDVRIPSFGEVYKALEKVASSRTVPDIYAWGSKPVLNFSYGDGNILGVIFIETPKFAAGGRFWNAMAIVVKEHGVVLGLLAKGHTEPAQVIVGGIQDGFIRYLGTETLELMLEVLTDYFECFMGRHGMGIDPTLQDSAWIGLDDVWGIDVDVETEDKSGVRSLEFSWSGTPGGGLSCPRRGGNRVATREVPLCRPVRNNRRGVWESSDGSGGRFVAVTTAVASSHGGG